MLRSQRSRVVLGLTGSLVGLGICLFGPAASLLLLLPDLSPQSLIEAPDVSTAALTYAGTMAASMWWGGLALAFVGGLSSFVEWARWFARHESSHAA
jgi:hypothetical protein